MKFSGLNNRGIAKKKELSFSLDISLSNTTGMAEFGLSGDGAVPLRLHFESGFVYDRPYPTTNDGDYVFSYFPEDSISISGNISGDSATSLYNYDINGSPANLLGEGSGTGISRFFINTTGVNVHANLDIAADPVSHSIYFPDFFRERNLYTGALINTDEESDIIIYSGFVKDPTGLSDGTDWSLDSFDANISAGSSGLLKINPSGGDINKFYDVNLVLYTNLGQLNKRFLASGQISESSSYILSTIPFDDDFEDAYTSELVAGGADNVNKTGTYFTTYKTYTDQVATSGQDFNISLSYLSGYTGDLFTGENGDGILGYNYDNPVLSGSGYIEGSGYLSSGTEGVRLVSGTDTLSGSPTSGLGITGDVDATGSFYFYATGDGTYYFSMGGTGYSTLSGDGGLSGTRVLTTGTITGSVSATGIGGESPYTGSFGQEYGSRLYSGEVTGAPSSVVSLDYPLSGLENAGNHSGILVESILASGVMTGDGGTAVTGDGDWSGILTGYEKSFTSTWDLQTGYVTGDLLVDLVSFKAGSHFSGAAGINAGYTKQKSASLYAVNDIVTRVENYNKFDNESMTVLLEVSGMLTGYEQVKITGAR